MRWITYVSPTDGADHPGLLEDGHIHGLPGPASVLNLLTAPEGLSGAAEQARSSPFEVVGATGTKLRAPIPAPPSVRDFMSFEVHVKNALGPGGTIDPLRYQQPTFYFTNRTRPSARTRRWRSPPARRLSTTNSRSQR